MKKLRYGLIPALGLLSMQAMAELPAEVTSAISDSKSDVMEIAGLILGVLVVGFGFKVIRRFL